MPRSPRSRPSSRRWLVILLALVAAAAPAAAAAQTRSQALLQDCLTNGRVVGHYTQQEYSQALANMPTDAAEYSDCGRVIRQAQLAAAAGANVGHAGSPPAGSPAAAASAAAAANPRQDPLNFAAPAERAAVAQARRGGSAQVDVGGQVLRPSVVASRSSSLATLPTPLLVALSALILIALAVVAQQARKLVRARRSG